MGTDIHLYTEVRVDGCWNWRDLRWNHRGYEEHAALYGDRCYDCFAILADVRNGYGFAGIDTGDGFVPISAPRGLPGDLSPELAAHLLDGIDHTPSYLTLADLLAYDWTRQAVKRGVINALEYECWSGWGREHGEGPQSWSGSIDGRGLRHVDNATMETLIAEATRGLDRWSPERKAALGKFADTYTQVSWSLTYADAASGFWIKAMPVLLQLGAPNDVRIVFYFDS